MLSFLLMVDSRVADRRVGDRNILDAFALKFCAIAERHVRYIVVSGFVAISHGRRRTTEDIDMIIEVYGYCHYLNNSETMIDSALYIHKIFRNYHKHFIIIGQYLNNYCLTENKRDDKILLQ